MKKPIMITIPAHKKSLQPTRHFAAVRDEYISSLSQYLSWFVGRLCPDLA
jgi:hypothetical protein